MTPRPAADTDSGIAQGSGTRLLELLPHPAFVVEVDGDESFHFVYANVAYRALLSDEPVGDLRVTLPANALVAHVRAFSHAARDRSPVSFETDWGAWPPARRIAVDVRPIVERDGSCRLLVGAAYDVSEHRRVEAALAHRTRHDPLTELPNRVMLVEWLEHAIGRRTPGESIGLVLVDIDHFKVVNDSLGHAVGDELLMMVAQRMERVLRSGDRLARLGGDELAIVCHGARSSHDVVTLGRRILSVFSEPFTVDGVRDVQLRASAGVTFSSRADDTPFHLLRDADVAMFAAKETGRGHVELFDDRMRDRAVQRLELESALRRALVERQFHVHYQPVVELPRSEVVGFEALVRWDHPVTGMLAPDEFLGLAEETGLIVPLGAWVLEEACAQASRWREESPPGTALTVAVNLSGRQLTDPDLLAVVQGALARAGLPPTYLELDVPERVLMADRDCAGDVLRRLSDLGVRVAVDDFGAGESALAHLKAFAVDSLKIDPSFVRGLGKDAEDSAVVAAIVQMGHALGMRVSAEGIEQAGQLEILRALDCDLGQGYYFARPQPGEIVRALVHHRFRWSRRASA